MKSQTIVCPCCGTTYDRTDEAPEFERIATCQAVNQELLEACKSALHDMTDGHGERLPDACPVTFEKLRKALGFKLFMVTNRTFSRCIWATDKESALKSVPLTYANAYEIKPFNPQNL